MSRTAWSAFTVLVVLGVANLVYAWHLDQTSKDRQDALRQDISQQFSTAAGTQAETATALDGKLDRNWKMIVTTRKTTCDVYFATAQVPHYLYAAECDLPNMSSRNTYVKFWQTPTGWNQP